MVRSENSADINYPEIRKLKGDVNSQALQDQGGRFRHKLRLAFDTMVYQYCANERTEQEETIVENGSSAGLKQIFRKTVQGRKPSGRKDDPDELSYIYALCELGRRHDAEIIEVPTVTIEKRHSRHGHYHGQERLDFKVPYTPYPISCGKMKNSYARLITGQQTADECWRDLPYYPALIAHLTGEKQKKRC